MKIDNIAQLTAPKAPRENARNETAPAAKTEAAEASADVSHLRQPSADNRQDIDTVRVEELRKAIAEGRLDIRADKIADGLIESVRELVEG